MSRDLDCVAKVKAWITHADTDIGAGVWDLATDMPYTGDAVFHAQQGAEKALKAFLAWHGVLFDATGDLAVLGRLCTQIDMTLVWVTRRAERLTEFEWKYRYPGEPEEPSEDEAESALDLAAEVYTAIMARLPPEVRPTPYPVFARDTRPDRGRRPARARLRLH